MIGYEQAPEYDTTLWALHYTANHNVEDAHPDLTDIEREAMDLAYELGRQALSEGNPPVGAVLIVNDGEHVFSAKTHDKASGKIIGHAEIVAYEDAYAAGAVRDDLSHATLVTTAVPCTTCTSIYAAGKIRTIIAAAPRRLIFPVSGIMRPRDINMHELLKDGDTDTTTVLNFRLGRSLGLFTLYGKGRGHEVPKHIDPYLRRFIEA